MKRVKGWQKILVQQIAAARHTPFEWGKHDCAVWACDVVLALTGADLAHDFRGTYTTELGAAKVIKKFAGGGLEALAAKRAEQAGLAEVSPRFASRGDIVVVNSPGPALGIVGPHPVTAFCAGPGGLTAVPKSRWIRAWKV